MQKSLLDRLLTSEEPAIRYKTRVQLLKENPRSPAIVSLQEEIRRSPRVQRLLSGRTVDGQLEPVDHPYHKWFGAHWVLVHLAEIGYPLGDRALLPLREQVYRYWLSEKMQRLVPCQDASQVYRVNGVPVLQGRARRCASQQANALFSTLKLALADERAETLVALLLQWQWPDGGWNCDKDPQAHTSSFTESHVPLRALALYSQQTGYDTALTAAITKAASVFLRRHLFKRLGDGQVIHPEFCKLHYPCYWHYDLLFGLKIMAEAGFLHDSRCAEALDLLEQKALPDGGWTTDGRIYYRVGKPGRLPQLNEDKVSWGKPKERSLNEWVTVDALYVLTEAHRMKL
jgi:hypothetical protein